MHDACAWVQENIIIDGKKIRVFNEKDPINMCVTHRPLPLDTVCVFSRSADAE